MAMHPILLVGGSGVVGSLAARYLRDAHPAVPLLIGGRTLARAEEVAARIGNAEGVVLDLQAEDLGLGDRGISAVAVLMMDQAISGLRFAQRRGAPHVSISPSLHEIAPEVAGYIFNPSAAPVVLGTEWLVGATSVPTLTFTKAFGRVKNIHIGALLDEEDTGGPAQTADLERVTKTGAPALGRREGVYYWRVGEDAEAVFRALDGTEMQASALSPNDVVALAVATGAPDVHFDVASGASSSRRRGQPASTEIIVELTGEDHAGRPLRTRHAIVHPEGQFPLTALGVAMVLERLVGLDGLPGTPPGLYFPSQLLEPGAWHRRFAEIGGKIIDLTHSGDGEPIE